MELNRPYVINIVGQNEGIGNGSFVAVEILSCNSSEYYRDYYSKFSGFNKCGDWFRRLDYPVVEIGQIIVAQIDKKKNIWTRGMITNVDGHSSVPPKLYLIDSQRFADNRQTYSLKNCPSKFKNLILPTYNIDVNFCLKNDDLKSINKLIVKNQYGELSFSFTPKSYQNNVYVGEIIVNNINDCSHIPLKKILKNVQSKKYFNDISSHIPYQFTTFNPLNYSHLRNIFIPRDPYNIINVDKCERYNNYSLDNNCDSIEEFSSTNMSTFEDFSSSDDSALAMKKTPDDKKNCSYSSSKIKDNLSFSEYSFENKLSSTVVDNVYKSNVSRSMDNVDAVSKSSSKCFKKEQRYSRSYVMNLLTKKLSNQNSEQHPKFEDQEMMNYLDENISNIANTINTTTNVMDTVSTSSESLEDKVNTSKNPVINRLTIECLNQNTDGHQDMTASSGNIVHQNTLKDGFEAKLFINSLMEKMQDCLIESSKLMNTNHQINNNLSMEQKVGSHSSSFSETIIQSVCALDNDTIWWSSDDEN